MSSIMLNRVYLKSGEVYISTTPEIVWTVLGSCVTVILYSKEHQISALSHAQLPSPSLNENQCRHTCPKPCFQSHDEITSDMRFVSCSIKYLVTELENMGIKRSELKASLLGGAQMNASNSDLFRIGERNVSLAKELLMSYHINIEYEDTLGNKSRALNYNSSDGTFLMKKN